MFTSAETNRLIAEIGQLRSQVEHLRQRNLDLEISLSTISEHGDYIQAQLQDEIAERRRTENSLSKLLSLISSEKEDLEILLQTLTEHSDAIDSHWHQKLDEAFALANQDGLTKIANRRRFDEYLEQQWQQVMQEQETISVILCDVDYFKPYNDTYGHLAGDRCLKSVAQALQKSVLYPLDLAARYGGEEFAAILPKTGIEGAVQVARRIQFAIAQLQIPHAHSAVSNHLTLSIGIVCTTPIQGQSLVQILDQADQLLYQAKQNGRNQIFSAMAAPLP